MNANPDSQPGWKKKFLIISTFDDDIDCLMILVKIFTNGSKPVLQWFPVIRQVYDDSDFLPRFQLIAEGETVAQLHLKIGKLTASLEKLIR